MKSIIFTLFIISITIIVIRGYSKPLLLYNTKVDGLEISIEYFEPWLYSPHDLIIKVKRNIFTTKKLSITLHNDGAVLSSNNFDVIYSDDDVCFTFTGNEELTPIVVVFNIKEFSFN